jgi:hypothetical protein
VHRIVHLGQITRRIDSNDRTALGERALRQ